MCCLHFFIKTYWVRIPTPYGRKVALSTKHGQRVSSKEFNDRYGIWEDDEFALYQKLLKKVTKPFVYSRGKRKTQLQRDIEALDSLLCKTVKYEAYQDTVTYYECEDYIGCPFKKSCTKAKGNRKMQVSKNFVRQRQDSLARITSEQGILLRMNRSIQSEGAFGVVKYDYGFQRFLHRGKIKVFTKILIVARGYNINKYHNKIQRNRTGTKIHKKRSILVFNKTGKLSISRAMPLVCCHKSSTIANSIHNI